MKSRGLNKDYGDMPVVSVRMDFITPSGKLAYKQIDLDDSGWLSAELMPRLVADINEEFEAPLRCSEDLLD